MALMTTPPVENGWNAVDFSLPGVDGMTYNLADVKGEKGLVVMFICNHCPYVKAIVKKISATAKKLQENGIGVIAIMPNDVVNYPDDSFDNMKVFAAENDFSFPYVIDETQEIAKAYDAICTPDFFGFDQSLTLQYRGRFDSEGKSDAPAQKEELLDAMLEIAAGAGAPATQAPSMGCSIKWKQQAA